MATFTHSDNLRGAEFINADLGGARFIGADLSGVMMRGVELSNVDIDAPFLLSPGAGFLRVNGVDVAPLIEAELNRRFPGRAQRYAKDPDALRAAWEALAASWEAVLERVAAMPRETADISVQGEWSFAQTLRHMVFATDLWLGKAVLELEQPHHRAGLGAAADDDEAKPSYDEVLEAFASRVALVRGFLATVTAEELEVARKNPHAPEHPESTRSCVHVILEEGWEHLRYAVRDLDAMPWNVAGAA